MRFDTAFAEWARRVRTRLWLRTVFTGVALGLVSAAAVALTLWWARLSEWRPWAGALAAFGAAAAFLMARRARWSDEEVALYLDSRLGSKEAISTAVELDGGGGAERGEVVRAVTADALSILQRGDRKRASPRVLQRIQLVGALGVFGLAGAVLLPARAALPGKPRAVDRVQNEEVSGLAAIEKLSQLELSDAERKRRMNEMAKKAEALRAAVAKGLERREALSRISELGDAIKSERLRFLDEKNRAGLEEALGALDRDARLERSARALGNGDLSEFDGEMRRLANLAERDAREAAKRALEEARSAAARREAKALKKALDEQRRLFDEREQAAEMLRELARALGDRLEPEGRKALEEFDATGSLEARNALTEALMDALEGLDADERKRMAKRLLERMRENAGELRPMSREELERLARELSTEEGKRKMAEALRELANSPPSDASREQRALDEARRGLGQAQRQLSGTPLPVPGTGQGQAAQGSGKGSARSPAAHGSAGHGGGSDRGTAAHVGETRAVDGKGLRAKAHPSLDPTLPMQTTGSGRVPGVAGPVADDLGPSGVNAAGPEQVRAIDRTEIPREYREQVGRYFEPR